MKKILFALILFATTACAQVLIDINGISRDYFTIGKTGAKMYYDSDSLTYKFTWRKPGGGLGSGHMVLTTNPRGNIYQWITGMKWFRHALTDTLFNDNYFKHSSLNNAFQTMEFILSDGNFLIQKKVLGSTTKWLSTDEDYYLESDLGIKLAAGKFEVDGLGNIAKWGNHLVDSVRHHDYVFTWDSVNNKYKFTAKATPGAGTGTVTSIATTSPITGGTITTTGTIGIQVANTSQSGYLSSTDWNTFNNKQPAGSYVTGTPWTSEGYLTSINSLMVTTALGYTPLSANQTITLGGILSGSGTTSITASAASGYYMPTTTDQTNWNAKITLGSLSGTSPITYNNGTGAIGIQVANTSQSGYLSSTDWNTFNNKQPAGSYLTAEVDGSVTNELQTLGTSGNTITLTGGGSVTAPYATTAGTVTNGIYTTSSWTGGDLSGTGLAATVNNNSHDHDSTTTVNLSANDIQSGFMSPLRIAQTSSYRFVSDTEKGTWNGKITNPTNARGVLKNDGFGLIAWAALSGNEITDALGYTPISANQTITLGGILSGSGTTSITASAASGYYMPTTTDQSNWNAKITLGSLSGTSPITYNNGTGAIGIQVANTSQSGYLSSTDWNTFNNKQPAGSYLTAEVDGSVTNELQTLGTSGNTITLTGGGSVTAPYATTAGTVTNGIYTTSSWTGGDLSGTGLAATVNNNSHDHDSTTTVNLSANDIQSGFMSPLRIAQTSSYRFVSDTEKGTWNGKITNPTNARGVLKNDGFGLIAWAALSGNEITDALGYTPISANQTITLGGILSGSGTTSITASAASGYYMPTTTDQSNWNAKITLGSLSGTSPITYNNGTGAIGIQAANTSQSGYLSSTDWNTFNGKLSSLSGAVLTTGNQSVGGNKTYTGHNDYTSGSIRLPSQAQSFPSSGDIYFDSLWIKYYEGANIRKVASQTWVLSKGYITNPTNANGFLKNDGFGLIAWGALTSNNVTDALGFTPIASNADNTLSGKNTLTGSLMADGEVELTADGDVTQSVSGKNTLIILSITEGTTTLTSMADGQLLWVSNDKDSPDNVIIASCRNGSNSTLTIAPGKSFLLRYRNSESIWYATGF
jgi:hypothetical protein